MHTEWDSKMKVAKTDDLKSKIAACTVLEKTIAKNNIITAIGINVAIAEYKDILKINLERVASE
jgi:hypothetical protein